MPNIPYTDQELLSDQTKSLLARLPEYNIFKMLARSEEVFVNFIRFNNAVLNESPLDPILREVAIIRTGYRAGAEYEVHHHVRIGRTLGMSETDMALITSSVDYSELPEDWQLMIRVADDLAAGAAPSHDNMMELKARLSEREIIDLVFAVGCYMMVARLLVTTGVEVEPAGANEPLNVRRSS